MTVCASSGPEAADGLVDLDDGAIRFTHPLFISAILRSVSPAPGSRRIAGSPCTPQVPSAPSTWPRPPGDPMKPLPKY